MSKNFVMGLLAASYGLAVFHAKKEGTRNLEELSQGQIDFLLEMLNHDDEDFTKQGIEVYLSLDLDTVSKKKILDNLIPDKLLADNPKEWEWQAQLDVYFARRPYLFLFILAEFQALGLITVRELIIAPTGGPDRQEYLTELPPNFDQLINLEHIRFENIGLQTLPNFSVFKKLQHLVLQRLSWLVDKEIPASIFEIPSLYSLEIYNCGFTQLPVIKKENRRLRRFTIHNESNFQMIDPSIGKLKGLRYLRFYNLSISHLPASIGELKQLEGLRLEHSNIVMLPNNIGSLQNLKEINLMGTQIKSLPASFFTLKKIEEFSCPIPITPEIYAWLLSLPSLRALWINGLTQGQKNRLNIILYKNRIYKDASWEMVKLR